MKKIFIASLFLVLIILSLLFLSGIKNEIIINESSDSFSIKIKYPKISDKKIDAQIKEIIQKNIAETKNYPDPDKRTGMSYKNELFISYEKPLISKKFTGIVLYIMTYTGGAHPNTEIYARTFDNMDGKELKIDAFFNKDGIEILKSNLIRLLSEKLSKEGFDDKSWIKNGLKNSPLENFVADDKGILFYFGQYEVAPYSMGIQKAYLKYSPDSFRQKTKSK